MTLERIQIVALAFSIIFLLFIFELIRNKKIKEAYGILWLFFAVGFIVLAVWKKGLIYLSDLLGIYYAPASLFLFLNAVIVLILIQFSIVISDQNEKIRRLVQEIGLLKAQLGKGDETEETKDADQ